MKKVLRGERGVPMPGPRFHARLNPNGMMALKIWWRADLSKQHEYHEEVILPLEEWQRRREFEIDFTASSEEVPLWSITPANEDYTIEYNPRLAVFRVWDFGRHSAVLFAQIVEYSDPVPWVQLRIIGEVDSLGRTTTELAEYVKHYSKQNFGDTARFVDICDVAGKQYGRQTNRTDIQLVKKHTGIRIRFSRKFDRGLGIDTIGGKITECVDGHPGLLIHPDKCPILTDGLRGSIPMALDGGIAKGKLYDRYEHLADCLRYLACWALKLTDIVRDVATARRMTQTAKRPSKAEIEERVHKYAHSMAARGTPAMVNGYNPTDERVIED